MSFDYNKKNISYARQMRKNMTAEERKLWLFCLKDLNVKFRKQKPIGNYIVDFYCKELQLVIEIDGSQHFENVGKDHDKMRDEFLNSLGIRVVRIANNDVRENFNAVRELIYNIIAEGTR